MNHNILKIIADKLVEMDDLKSIVYLMGQTMEEWCNDVVLKETERKIIDYIKTADFDKGLFSGLFLYLNNINTVHHSEKDPSIVCTVEDLPKLVYYREKCGLTVKFHINRVNRISGKDLSAIVKELMELGVDRVNCQIFKNNDYILNMLPYDYDDMDVLSYLCNSDEPYTRSWKVVEFYRKVEESQNKKIDYKNTLI